MSTKLGDRIKQMRLELEMTQDQLGYACGLKKSHISHFETGRRVPTLGSIEKLMIGFNCTHGDILD